MTAFIAPGSNVPSRIVFNSGNLDFGNNRIVNVDNLSLSIASDIVDLFILGSIIAADKTRAKLKVSLTGKIKSYPPELEAVAMGSSSIGTPNEIDYLDGQPTFQNPVLTIYDRNSKEIQYQFINAVFKSSKVTLKAEDFAEWDFELEAINVKEVYTS